MDVTAADLRSACYGEQFDALEAAVSTTVSGRGPNVAVVAPPFAGRDLLVEHAADCLDDPERIALDAVDPDGPVPDVATGEPSDAVVLEDCQYLFARRIGGFDRLDALLEELALAEPTVVTSWTGHAWRYLDAVRDVSRSFDRVVTLPPVDAVSLAALLEAHHDGPAPTFVETDAGGRVKTVTFDRARLPLWGDRSLAVPVPEVNTEYVRSGDGDGAFGDLEAVVYRKLVAESAGNPGVAARLWTESIGAGEIAPAYVEEYDPALSLADDTAFLLELVVANERVRRDTLDRIRPSIPVDQAIQTLSGIGLLDVDGEWVSIDPRYWRATVEHLEGRQLVW